MISSNKYCAILGNYGHKWPTLQAFHVNLFGECFEEECSTFAEASVCVQRYFKLQQLGIL